MYVVSTSRPSTAVFGAAVGQFCGGSTAYVVVNRGTLLSLFVCRAGDLGIDHVDDVHLPCTLKYVFAVPVVDTTPPFAVVRHLLFLCTIKQEVLLVALERPADSATITVTSLYRSGPEDALYQYDPGEVDLCCCSPPTLLGATALSSSPPPPPFVAFALARGGLYFFDVFAALAREGVKRKRSSHLARLFSADVVAAVVHRGKSAVFTHCYLDASEYDLRDIAFGCHAPSPSSPLFAAPQRALVGGQKGGAASLPFYILYADPYGKVHVSEYELSTLPVTDSDTESGGGGGRAAARPPGHRWVPSSPTSDHALPSERRLQRRGFLQSNVDPTASRIAASRHGLFVIGNHLVSLVQQVRPRKSVSSREIPSRHGPLDVSCAALSVDAAALVIGFSDGVLVRVVVPAAELGGEEAELEFQFLPHPAPTVPTGLVALRPELYLLYSRFDSTLTVRLGDLTCERVLHNCGPVLDMTTQQNGPRCSVLACTGVHRNSGVSVLRTAVMLREQAAVPLRHAPQRVLCAGGLLCVTSAVANRFFRVSMRTTSIEELPASTFPAVVADFAVLELGQDTAEDLLTVITERGVVWLRMFGTRCETVAQVPRGRGEADYLFASARCGLLAVCDGTDVVVYRGQDYVCTIPSPSGVAVSALALVSPRLLSVGDWDGNVVLYELKRQHAEVKGQLRLDSVARSIASVTPHGAALDKGGPSCLLYVGTFDGNLLETTAELMASGQVRRSVFIAPHPLELQQLGGQAGLLCLGDVPLVVLCRPDGVQLTGLHLMGVPAAATVDADAQCYALYSKQDCQLHVGVLDTLEKTTRTFLPLGDTVTQLHDMPMWGGCAVALRKVERDEVAFLPSTLIHSPWATGATNWRAGAVPLLENERCVFLQTVHLDAAADGADGGERGEGDADWQCILLVGSSFTFPDEHRARSGRITWCTLRETSQRRRLHVVASKDIGGALQCCAAVPNYKGRIALGVNGCVCLYKWNSEDQTFVAEERCRLGLTITKLIPLHNATAASSVLVALDVRYSAFVVEVDTLQGSLKVLCRDANLRGLMDGHVDTDTGDIFLFDDNFNFTALRMTRLEAPEDPEKSAVTPPQYRFEVLAQCHLGDLITCVRPGSFAAALTLTARGHDAAPADHQLLLPGVSGQQLVFASVSGAFGVVTPVRLPTYLLLHAVEVALERVTVHLASGLSHRAFKDVLQPGQERGVSLAATASGSALVRDRLKRYEAINVVDGDYVETFLQLAPTMRAHVCQIASEVVAQVCSDRMNDDGAFVALSPSQEQCRAADGSATRRLAEYSEEALAKVNALLHAAGLPSVPLAPAALERLLINLQRVH